MAGAYNKFFVEFQTAFWFLYGLVFYTMGISILVHSRQYSRLILAKSLPWLGVFGIVCGFYEWGYIFVPIMTQVTGNQNYPILVVIHQVVLAVAFTILFQFGVELLRPFKPQFRWVRLVPTFFFWAWLIGPFTIGFSFIPSIDTWSAFVEANARYFLCLPASTIAVIGLIHQQRLQIKPMKLPIIDNMIRLAAGSLAAYGFFSGIFVPKTFFFPGTILNNDSFAKIMIAPPYFYRAIAGLLLLYSVIRALEVFNFETDDLIHNMEESQVIANERERIARDLHDGALQQVYATGLLAQSLKKHIDPKQGHEAERLINAINQAISQLREFLPQNRPDLKTVDLISALTPKIEEARRYIRIDTFWNNIQIPVLSIEQANHVIALLSEAISNAIRHAKSERIEVSLNYQNKRLVLEIRDFGKGISSSAEQGFGLKNMHDRARLLGASLSIDSENAKGTTVKLEMPLEDARDEH